MFHIFLNFFYIFPITNFETQGRGLRGFFDFFGGMKFFWILGGGLRKKKLAFRKLAPAPPPSRIKKDRPLTLLSCPFKKYNLIESMYRSLEYKFQYILNQNERWRKSKWFHFYIKLCCMIGNLKTISRNLNDQFKRSMNTQLRLLKKWSATHLNL